MGIWGATVLVLLAATCISVGTAIGKRYHAQSHCFQDRRGRLGHGHHP